MSSQRRPRREGRSSQLAKPEARFKCYLYPLSGRGGRCDPMRRFVAHCPRPKRTAQGRINIGAKRIARAYRVRFPAANSLFLSILVFLESKRCAHIQRAEVTASRVAATTTITTIERGLGYRRLPTRPCVPSNWYNCAGPRHGQSGKKSTAIDERNTLNVNSKLLPTDFKEL